MSADGAERRTYQDGLCGWENEVEEASRGIGAIGLGEVEDGGHGLSLVA